MSDSVPCVKCSDDTKDAIGALEECGAVIIEDFLAPIVLEALNREVDSLMDREKTLERSFPNEAIATFFGDSVDHLAGLAGKSPTFNEHVLCHPVYMAICDHCLLPSCNDYQLNVAHLMERGPGCEAQFIHRDEWVWKRLPPVDGQVQVASLVALTDFTADNGGTLLVPGSHRWVGDRYPEPEEIVAAQMPAGSALVYLGSTFHGGGANITAADVRRGLHVSYTLGWLRTEENQCLATPAEVVRNLPLRAQQLLGFGIHDDLEVGGGYLGAVELEPPAERLVKKLL